MIRELESLENYLGKLNIIKKLDNSLESWDYERLDETSRVANEIKKQLS
jgi:mitochondrial fission protein ELM1